jgi:outer membrane protein assembly factor BamB
MTDVGRLVSFDARTGARLSATTVPVRVSAAQELVAADGAVVVDQQDGSLAGIDALTGHTRWTARLESGLRDVAMAGRRVWLLLGAGGRDRLQALDPATGRTVARVTLPTGEARAIATAGDRLFVTTGDGRVVAVRPR